MTTAEVSGADATDYQDSALLATATVTQSGDYVFFADVTAHNTGGSDGDVNCGLYLDGSGFGGGGTSVATGATARFTAVGASHLDNAKTVTLSCNINNASTYDLTGIKIRIHTSAKRVGRFRSLGQTRREGWGKASRDQRTRGRTA